MDAIRRVIWMALVSASVSMLGCRGSSELAGPDIRLRKGPAYEQPIRRVVALRSTCGALTAVDAAGQNPDTLAGQQGGKTKRDKKERVTFAEECPEKHMDGVDALVRSALAFQGFSVLDSETVNATTFKRKEIRDKRSTDGVERVTRLAEARGSRFIDATPMVQDEVLAELGADGIVNTRIWIGAGVGLSVRRNVDVQIRLLHVPSAELVWAVRCRVEAGFELNERPIMKAARCAAERSVDGKRAR